MMVLPRIRYDPIVELGNIYSAIAHIADQVLFMMFIKESGYVFDVVTVDFLECCGSRKAHCYYSICDIG